MDTVEVLCIISNFGNCFGKSGDNVLSVATLDRIDFSLISPIGGLRKIILDLHRLTTNLCH